MTRGEITYNGKAYPTLDVYCPSLDEIVTLAEASLWLAIGTAYENGDKEAESIDNAIYFYCEDGKLDSFNSQKDVERYFKEEEDVEF